MPKITLQYLRKNTKHKYATEAEALVAVKRDGLALRFVHNQTPDICLAAVMQNGYTLQYVREQTPEICLAAVRKYGLTLQYVRNQTLEICLAAVKQTSYALKYVNPDVLPDDCSGRVVNIDGVEYTLQRK